MYRYRFTRFSVCMLFAVCTLLLSSCGTRAPRVDYRELARAAVRLEMDIDADDNHRLYVEVADWIGVPYRHGGTTHRGTDCSGFTSAVYKKSVPQETATQFRRPAYGRLPKNIQAPAKGRRLGVLS